MTCACMLARIAPCIIGGCDVGWQLARMCTRLSCVLRLAALARCIVLARPRVVQKDCVCAELPMPLSRIPVYNPPRWGVSHVEVVHRSHRIEFRNRRDGDESQGVAARVLLGAMIVEEVGAKYDSYDKRVVIWPVRLRAP